MVMSKRDDTMQLRMRILIVMAESLLPLKGGCPNIHKQGTYCPESSFLFGS